MNNESEKVLEYFPVRQCEFEMKNDIIVTVLYNKFEKSFLDKIFKNSKNKIAKIDFDKIGSFVWLQCDGESDVRKIVELTEKEFVDEESIKDRVLLFFNQLESRSFIRFFERKNV